MVLNVYPPEAAVVANGIVERLVNPRRRDALEGHGRKTARRAQEVLQTRRANVLDGELPDGSQLLVRKAAEHACHDVLGRWVRCAVRVVGPDKRQRGVVHVRERKDRNRGAQAVLKTETTTRQWFARN